MTRLLLVPLLLAQTGCATVATFVLTLPLPREVSWSHPAGERVLAQEVVHARIESGPDVQVSEVAIREHVAVLREVHGAKNPVLNAAVIHAVIIDLITIQGFLWGVHRIPEVVFTHGARLYGSWIEIERVEVRLRPLWRCCHSP